MLIVFGLKVRIIFK